MSFGLLDFGRLHNEGRRTFTLRSGKAEDGSRTRQWPFEEVYFGKKALPQNAKPTQSSLPRRSGAKRGVNPCLEKFSVSSVLSVANKKSV
jgi:hypothetical protein